MMIMVRIMIMVVMAMMRIIGLKHTGGPGPGYNDGDDNNCDDNDQVAFLRQ